VVVPARTGTVGVVEQANLCFRTTNLLTFAVVVTVFLGTVATEIVDAHLLEAVATETVGAGITETAGWLWLDGVVATAGTA